MDEHALSAYLARIGAERPAAPDAAALRALSHAHLVAVPFENLSIHLGEPISLDEDRLLDKLVSRRRGGFCYELNGAFAVLLAALGFEVAHVAARVFGEDRLGPPFDHLALLVRPADGTGTWLVDVGFGRDCPLPLRFDARGEQEDAGGRFALADAAEGDVDVLLEDVPQYRLERRRRALADFLPACWWHQTSPASGFTRNTVCTRLRDDGGRVTLHADTLVQTTAAGERTERRLAAGELLAAYRELFGVVLERLPAIPSASPPAAPG
jgi:N-hydroxyarylamine O-acetyltransferase